MFPEVLVDMVERSVTADGDAEESDREVARYGCFAGHDCGVSEHGTEYSARVFLGLKGDEESGE